MYDKFNTKFKYFKEMSISFFFFHECKIEKINETKFQNDLGEYLNN